MPTRLPPPNISASRKWWYIPLTLVAIASSMLIVYRLSYGHIDGVAWAGAGVLCMTALATLWRPKNARAFDVRNAAHQRRPTDILGVIWFFNILLGPVVGWFLTGLVDLTPGNWRWRLGVRAFLCMVVPVVGVMPLLRYVKGPPATPTLVFLLLGTLFPMATGWTSAADFVRGSQWQSIDIVATRAKAARSHGRTYLQPDHFVDLADGRTLRAARSIQLNNGPATALILLASKRILGVNPPAPD